MSDDDYRLVARRRAELVELATLDDRTRTWAGRAEATLRRVLPAGHWSIAAFRECASDLAPNAGPINTAALMPGLLQQRYEAARSRVQGVLTEVLDELQAPEGDAAPPDRPAVLTIAEQRDLEVVIERLREADDADAFANLTPDDRAELLGEVATLEGQHQGRRPKRIVVKATLTRIGVLIGGLTLGTAGSLVAGELQPAVHHFLQRL